MASKKTPKAEDSEEAPEMLMRTGDRLPRSPKAPSADERSFYKSPTGMLTVSEPRFITVNDNLEPDGTHATSTLLDGLTYTQARDISTAASGSAFDRIVRRHEVIVP